MEARSDSATLKLRCRLWKADDRQKNGPASKSEAGLLKMPANELSAAPVSAPIAAGQVIGAWSCRCLKGPVR
jgi:hypothetical protein